MRILIIHFYYPLLYFILFSIALLVEVAVCSLCGSSEQIILLQNQGDDGSGGILGFAEAKFESCCDLLDGNNLNGEGDRVITFENSLIDLGQRIGGSNEPNTFDCKDFTLSLKSLFSDTNKECCETCSCYGDPICRSFNHEKDVWILCDARTSPMHEFYGDSVKYDRCKMTKQMCETQKDHEGKTCHYLAADPYGKHWSVTRRGSPCVYNPNSTESKIVLYEIPDKDFNIEAVHSERGTISKIYMTLSGIRYTLKAKTCKFDHSPPASEAKIEKEDLIGGDSLWHILDEYSGVSLMVRCFGNRLYYVNNENISITRTHRKRLNIESIVDPYLANRKENNGFCVNGILNKGKSTTVNTENLELSQVCRTGLLNQTKAEIFRSICDNEALPQSSIPHCIKSFCSRYFYPNYETIKDCTSEFELANDLNDISLLGITFCKAVLDTTEIEVIEECFIEFQQFKKTEIVTDYLERVPCIQNITHQSNDCSNGVSIESYNINSKIWEEILFLPNNLCSQDIMLNACEYPSLFHAKIRLKQRKAKYSCNQIERCLSISGFFASIEYRHPGGPTISPTLSPTEYPSLNPSSHPSEKPSASPTNYPSTSPTTLPTSFPTEYPTILPTESPTMLPSLSPTYITQFPTPAIDPESNPPTQNVDCTPMLCNSHSILRSLSDTGFSSNVSFDSCCLKTFKPSTDCTQKNITDSNSIRYFGFKNSYCSSEHGGIHEKCTKYDMLTVQVTLSKDESTECCLSCSCFGDPRCYSFYGVYDEFILCDGRAIPSSKTERCIIRRDVCQNVKDHEGNNCKWIEIAPDFEDVLIQNKAEKSFSVPMYGSPCKYDTKRSKPSYIDMYSTEALEFSLMIRQYDRGYIDAIYVRTVRGNYSLEAKDCLNNGIWKTTILDSSAEPDTWKEYSHGLEKIWRLRDSNTKIEVSIKCTGTRYKGEFSYYFMNIDYIKEPSENRIQTSKGFCPSGRIKEKALASTKHSEYINTENLCHNWNSDVNIIMLRNSMRAITGKPMITSVGVIPAIEDFCETHYIPSFSSKKECVNSFSQSEKIKDIFRVFCRAVLITKEDQDQCEENLEMMTSDYKDNYIKALEQGRELYIISYDKTCSIKANKAFDIYGFGIESEANVCKSSVELQYFYQNEWKAYMRIPGNNPPCQQYHVEFRYGSNEVLFTYPIRLVQKHSYINCSVCEFVSAVDFSVQFVRT